MDNNYKEVCISIIAERKNFEFDDYFYSKHSLTTVKQYLSKVGVWKEDIDEWFPRKDWVENEDALPEYYLEYGAEIKVRYFRFMMTHGWGKDYFPIDKKIDRWLENKKEVGKIKLKSNFHKKVNKDARSDEIFLECWIGNSL